MDINYTKNGHKEVLVLPENSKTPVKFSFNDLPSMELSDTLKNVVEIFRLLQTMTVSLSGALSYLDSMRTDVEHEIEAQSTSVKRKPLATDLHKILIERRKVKNALQVLKPMSNILSSQNLNKLLSEVSTAITQVEEAERVLKRSNYTKKVSDDTNICEYISNYAKTQCHKDISKIEESLKCLRALKMGVNLRESTTSTTKSSDES